MSEKTPVPPLINQIIEALDVEHLRGLVYQYVYSTERGRSEVAQAYADQEKF